MARVTVQVEGGEELVRKLHRIGVDVDAELEAAALLGAAVIKMAANTRAPAPEIESEVVERAPGHVEVEIGPPEEKWFWRFLETGAGAHQISGAPLVFEAGGGTVAAWAVSHPGMAAKPFLRPAFDQESDNAGKRVGDVLRKVIER